MRIKIFVFDKNGIKIVSTIFRERFDYKRKTWWSARVGFQFLVSFLNVLRCFFYCFGHVAETIAEGNVINHEFQKRFFQSSFQFGRYFFFRCSFDLMFGCWMRRGQVSGSGLIVDELVDFGSDQKWRSVVDEAVRRILMLLQLFDDVLLVVGFVLLRKSWMAIIGNEKNQLIKFIQFQ